MRPVTPGSPFTVKVFGEGRMKESITRKRQASSIATVGSTCDLNLKIPGRERERGERRERGEGEGREGEGEREREREMLSNQILLLSE